MQTNYTRLTFSPKANPASPAVKMFLAALMSRSWVVLHSGHSQWRRKYVRENKNNLCPTLTANMGTGGHNVPLLNVQGKSDTIRKLTPRECFNFQGFPKDFKLPNISNGNLYKQAGNSVVVPTIKRIASQIKKSMT